MKRLMFVSFLVAGCGAAPDPNLLPGFQPLKPTAGQIQLLSPIIRDIPAGSNVTYCSYIDYAFTEDTDVLAYAGSQSAGGHHIIVYSARQRKPIDTHVCNEDDMTNGAFLASTGSDTSAPAETIPAGVAFRVKAGTQIFFQSHWINATQKPIDGQGAMNLDVKPADANRTIAGQFVTLTTSFELPPGPVTKTTECTVGEPLKLYILGGHEHGLGTKLTIEKVSGGQATMLYDKDWNVDYEFNTPFVIYGLDKPLTLDKGEGMRVTCTWNNDTGKTLYFPDEMCVGYGYYFPSQGRDLYCIDGVYPSK